MEQKLLNRIITGTILGFTVLGSIIYGGLPLFIITMAVIVFATKEYVMILKHKGFFPSINMIIFADILFALLAYLNRFNLLAFAVTVTSIATFIWVLFRGKQPYIANVATTILGFIYSGLFPLYLIFIRDIGSTPMYQYMIKMPSQNEGLGYLILLFFCVLFTDTGCYYFGMKYGKNKLAPIISPNKTIEGAIGGSICSILGAIGIGHFLAIPWYHCIIIGILIAFFAQIGDLCESLIKRDAGVKDSGNTLPGHGGFLDRTDSYVFTLPVLYYYFQYIIYSDGMFNSLFQFFKGLI